MPIPANETARRLSEIKESPITGGEFDDPAWDSHGYYVQLPYIMPFQANIEDGNNDSASLDFISVPEDLRGNRIATRLVGSLVHLLKSKGYIELTTVASSSYTIKIFETLFGDGNLRYSDTADPMGRNLPITTDQVLKSYELNSNLFPQHKSEMEIYVAASIGKISIDNFEPPILH